MADPAKYLKTWNLKPESKLLRVYLSAWETGTSDITFCKLFWGILFAPLGYFFQGLIAPFEWLYNFTAPGRARRLEKRRAKRRARLTAELFEPEPEPKAPREFPKAKAILNWITATADRISAYFQRHPLYGKLCVWFANSFVVGGLIALVGFLTYLCVVNWNTGAFFLALIAFGGLVGAFVIFIGIIALLEYLSRETSIRQKLDAVANKVVLFFYAIGRFVASGYYSTKYRTCPRVLVEGAPSVSTKPVSAPS